MQRGAVHAEELHEFAAQIVEHETLEREWHLGAHAGVVARDVTEGLARRHVHQRVRVRECVVDDQ